MADNRPVSKKQKIDQPPRDLTPAEDLFKWILTGYVGIDGAINYLRENSSVIDFRVVEPIIQDSLLMYALKHYSYHKPEENEKIINFLNLLISYDTYFQMTGKPNRKNETPLMYICNYIQVKGYIQLANRIIDTNHSNPSIQDNMYKLSLIHI